MSLAGEILSKVNEDFDDIMDNMWDSFVDALNTDLENGELSKLKLKNARVPMDTFAVEFDSDPTKNDKVISAIKKFLSVQEKTLVTDDGLTKGMAKKIIREFSKIEVDNDEGKTLIGIQ